MNKKHLLILFLICLFAIFSIFKIVNFTKDKVELGKDQIKTETSRKNTDGELRSSEDGVNEGDLNNNSNENCYQPIQGGCSRVTKKPFGIFASPKNSPVKPERFQGYHTGADFEIFAGEENLEIGVRSICSGKIISVEFVNGYGGVIIQKCVFEGSPVTVLYGHLALTGISAKVGQMLEQGDLIGTLGEGFSRDTDGERKHLHLAIKRGVAVDVRGYVSQKSQLSGWLNPCLVICR